jgi:hypothetical protein
MIHCFPPSINGAYRDCNGEYCLSHRGNEDPKDNTVKLRDLRHSSSTGNVLSGRSGTVGGGSPRQRR